MMTVQQAAEIVQLVESLKNIRANIKQWETTVSIRLHHTIKDQWDRNVEYTVGNFNMSADNVGKHVREYFLRKYRAQEAAIIRRFHQLDVKVPDDGK